MSFDSRSLTRFSTQHFDENCHSGISSLGLDNKTNERNLEEPVMLELDRTFNEIQIFDDEDEM